MGGICKFLLNRGKNRFPNTIKYQNRAVGGRWVLEFCFSSVFYLLCVWVVISLQGLLFIGLLWGGRYILDLGGGGLGV
jgi:hypothetical protein